ncbi:MAG TPA: type IV pilus twitching motility protein PilT [Acidothermaceae bacterium]|jgi:twitching motility protein PilT
MPDPAGAKGVSSVESNGFFSDPDPQTVPDAVAYEFAAANAEDPLTAPDWSDAIPGFAPVAAAPVAPPRPLFPVVEPEAEVVSAAAPAAAFAVGIDEAAAPSMHQRSTNETTVTIAGLDLSTLLVQVIDLGGSDLHMTAGARPMIRLHGHLQPVEEAPELSPTVIQTMLYAILTQRQREKFEAELELDFAYALPGQARFRVNMYRQRDAVGAAFRLIPFEIKPLEALGIPPSVANFAMMPRGFVLVTGPTGSGKSTTLAGIVDLANRSRRDHIMTVEDPIEFLHQHKSCLINQREVGEDTHSFGNALKHVLRQDPDIILVGEMRDLETISVALTAAETGHLVFATLHTQDAAQTIDRVIDVFPPHQQQQVRVQLAGALQGVVSQTLVKTADGRGRAVATEVLVATPAIRNLIREGKTHQIYSALQAGARHGMHTMDQHLAELVKGGRITYEAALEKCHTVEDFNRLSGRG